MARYPSYSWPRRMILVAFPEDLLEMITRLVRQRQDTAFLRGEDPAMVTRQSVIMDLLTFHPALEAYAPRRRRAAAQHAARTAAQQTRHAPQKPQQGDIR